jgi:hypothetical protein
VNVDAAASVARVDATETAGTVTSAPGSGPIQIAQGAFVAPSQCNVVEALVWDNYTLPPAERQALTQNQRDYWTPLPLDNFATPAAAYSLRRLKSSYAGPAIRLRRASDNAEADINFLGFTGFTGAPIDTAAASAHCAATTCFVVTWYDQSGNARHNGQSTPASQPPFIFNCRGTLPCLQWGLQFLISGPQVTPLAATSYSAVGKSGVNTCPFIVAGQQFTSFGDGLNWGLWNGAAPLSASAPAGVWHAGNGTISGASSVVHIDGVDTFGSLATVTTPDWFYAPASPGAAVDCSMTEAVYWNGYALTAPERAALRQNQKSFWGTP